MSDDFIPLSVQDFSTDALATDFGGTRIPSTSLCLASLERSGAFSLK